MSELAHAIDVWYPVVRGGAAPSALFDASEARTPEHLAEAWAALPTGGRVVLRSVAPPGSRADLRPIESIIAGDGTAERFIEFPAADGSAALVPTRDGAALRGGMALLPRSGAGDRAFWTLIRAASPFGVAQRLGRPEIAVWTKGSESTESDDLPVLPVAGSIAVTASSPDLGQRVLVRALDRRGTSRAVLKVGLSDRTDDAVEREARSLELLAELVPDRAPRLIAEGRRADRSWLAQEVLEGRHAGDALSPAHARFLAELAEVTRDDQPLAENRFFLDSKRHLAALDPAEDPDWHAEYSGLLSAIEAAMDDRRLPVTLAHGDFTPWNLVRRRGEVRAFDWEHLAEDAPALYDLVHFHVQTGVITKQQQGERIFDDLERFFAGPANGVVRAAGIDRDDVLRLVGLYILHEGTTAEMVERLRPQTQLRAAWLRHARRAICRRLTGLLTERSLPSWTRIEREAA